MSDADGVRRAGAITTGESRFVRFVPQQVARALAELGGRVVTIVKRAYFHGQAAAADTPGDVVAQALQDGDLLRGTVVKARRGRQGAERSLSSAGFTVTGASARFAFNEHPPKSRRPVCEHRRPSPRRGVRSTAIRAPNAIAPGPARRRHR